MSGLPVQDGTAAVGGEFSVTARLPTLADVIAFKEGTSSPDLGYYRYVYHPYLRRIQEELQERFGCRHCRLAESREVALVELLLCLGDATGTTRLRVLAADGAPLPFADTGFFSPADAEGFQIAAHASQLRRGDVLVLALSYGAGVPPVPRQEAHQAAEAGASIVVVVPEPPARLPGVEGAKFWVTGLGGERRGGAVLGASDRVMGRLAEAMRRRGPWLSAREAGPRNFEAGGGDPRGACARVTDALVGLEGGHRAFLYSTGMTAITRALDLVRRPGKSQVIAVGHLFNDTYQTVRLAPRRPGEEPNVFLGVDELDRLPRVIGKQTAAILTETVTNPLNDVPDLPLLARAAREHGAALVVDNTLATPLACRPLALGADIVVHSTTKFLNGRNDHGGGALVVARAEQAADLEQMQARWNDRMSPLEAAALERGIRTLEPRMARFAANARQVAAFLSGHEAVRTVWSTESPGHRSFQTARRILGAPSSVISFTLARDSLEGLRAFYDSALDGVIKAPSLGSDQTLVCPYTMLTHYQDTDEQLREIGLPRFLVRVAVGCEQSIQPVIESLDAALRSSRA